MPGRGLGSADFARLVLASFLAALTGVLAQVRFSIGPVPYTMQNMGVILAGLLLPPRYALASMGLYWLLTALGLPLASGLRGGLGVVLGYTGGYLAGFIVAAPLMSILARTYLHKRGLGLAGIGRREFLVLLLLSLVAVLPVYILGFIVFAHYAVPGSKLYEWAEKTSSWAGYGGASRLTVLFVATVLIFIPQDLFMDHVLAITTAKLVARILEDKGVPVD